MNRDELIALADENSGRSLNILGYEVDRGCAREVYGALVWIEDQLHGLLERERERNVARRDYRSLWHEHFNPFDPSGNLNRRGCWLTVLLFLGCVAFVAAMLRYG